MQTMSKKIVAILLAGTASLVLASNAQAAGKLASDGTSAAQSAGSDKDAKIQKLEDEIQDLSNQVQDLKRSSSDQYTDVQNQQAAAVKVTINNGRPTISSADGNFTASIRTLAQLDWGYYSQSAAATTLPGPDLGSGANFRRVYLGVQGKLFGDWSYYFNYDFGGSNTEGPGHIQQVWLQYDGLGPFALRVGAFSPADGLEDATSASDTIFLERTAPADSARNIAGGDGRNAVSLVYSDDRWFGSLAYSGNKIQDSGAFDEQQAAVGRLAGLVYTSDDVKVLLSAGGSYVFKPQDAAAGSASTSGGTISFSTAPELTVDNTATKFVTTGSIASDHSWQWGLEAAAGWKSLYAQGGYFRYGIDLRTSKAAYGFNGWYGLATWVLTGESKPYLPATGAFGNPKPRIPFSFNGGGWGAWELAGRFSDLNLNDNAGVAGSALPTGGLRGGEQKIWTLGINWYPVSAVKFALQYENIGIDRLGTIPAAGTKAAVNNAQVGQTLNTFAIRTQVSF